MRWFRFSIPMFVVAAVILGASLPAAQAQTVTGLYSFCTQSGCPDGSGPFAGLLEAPDGSFYGSADYMSSSQNSGTLFRFTPPGALTTLEAFCSGSSSTINCPDGSSPAAMMIVGSDGNFYGTTRFGGAHLSSCTSGDCGTIYKITRAGVESILYSFCATVSNSVCQDGDFPYGSLVQGTDGNFYGITAYGGSGGDSNGGGGTVFQLTPAGILTTLYDFCKGQSTTNSCADGNTPLGGLVQASDGNFYGTTSAGGANGAGTVYQLKMTGTSTGTVKTIYSFTNGSEQGPFSALIEGSDGSLYGAAYGDGTHGGGSLFKVTTAGAFTTFYNFCSVFSNDACQDGAQPQGGLTLAGDGNYYGTTDSGGAGTNDAGTIYQLTPSGGFTTIYSFCTTPVGGFCTDGDYSVGALTAGSDGNLYGTSVYGGTAGNGNIYKVELASALPAPVQLTLGDSSVAPNTAVKLTWKVVNAFSKTMQQCNAFVQDGASGAGTWSGPQTGSVSGGVYTGSAEITPTTEGTYTYALTCGGVETGYATLTVTNGGSTATTTTTLATTPNPAIVGQTVTLKVTVTKNSGSGTPTGNVAIYVTGDSQPLTTLTLVNGSASISVGTASYPAGTYTVTGKYSGDSGDSASAGTTTETLVIPSKTTTTLTFSTLTPTIGESVTITATVAKLSGSGTPGGTVKFYADGAAISSNVTLSGGVANFTASTTGVAPGTYNITAKYSGDANDDPSTSADTKVPLKYATTTTITVTPNPVTPPAAAMGTVTVKRTGHAGVPSGTVNVYLEGALLFSATLNASGSVSGSYPTAQVPAGTYGVTVDYLGDADDAVSSGTANVTIK